MRAIDTSAGKDIIEDSIRDGCAAECFFRKITDLCPRSLTVDSQNVDLVCIAKDGGQKIFLRRKAVRKLVNIMQADGLLKQGVIPPVVLLRPSCLPPVCRPDVSRKQIHRQTCFLFRPFLAGDLRTAVSSLP